MLLHCLIFVAITQKCRGIVPITGTTKQGHLNENLATADLQFTTDEIRELDNTISQIKIYGDRYTVVEQQRVQN